MTLTQGFRLVTRGISVYCLFWALGEVLGLPVDINGVIHHIRLVRLAHDVGRFTTDDTYWIRYYAALSLGRLIGIGASLGFAVFFYRGGGRLKSFFLNDGAIDAGGRDAEVAPDL